MDLTRLITPKLWLAISVLWLLVVCDEVSAWQHNPVQRGQRSGWLTQRRAVNGDRVKRETRLASPIVAARTPLPTANDSESRSQSSQDSSNHRVNVIRGLTLNEATTLAFENSPEIRKIAWEIEKANGQRIQRSRLVNPSIGTMANEIGNEGQAGQYGIYLQRNIVRNNRVAEIQNAFQWKIQSLSRRNEVVQRQIAGKIGQLYAEYDYFRKMIALTEGRISEVSKIKTYAETLKRAGEIAGLELTRIEIELENQNQRVEQFKRELTRIHSQIVTYLPVEQPESVPDFDLESEGNQLINALPAEAPLATEPGGSSDSLPADGYSEHPQRTALLDEVEHLKWLVHYARSQQRPDLKWQTSVNFDAGTDDFFAGFQLNVPWMINDLKTGSIRAAQAAVQAKIEETNQIERQLLRQRSKLEVQISSTIIRINSIREKIIPLVDQNLKSTTEVFRAGETSYLELKQALELSYEVRENLLSALRHLLQNHIELETLVIE